MLCWPRCRAAPVIPPSAAIAFRPERAENHTVHADAFFPGKNNFATPCLIVKSGVCFVILAKTDKGRFAPEQSLANRTIAWDLVTATGTAVETRHPDCLCPELNICGAAKNAALVEIGIVVGQLPFH